MPSPERGDVVQQYCCRCHNITINAYNSSPGSEKDYERVYVGDDGIHITHHFLTLRTRNHAQGSKTSPNKLFQHLALSCLACKTLAYRIKQEVSPGSEAREGPVIPTEDWVEQETLRSKSGWIEVFVGPGGFLVGKDAIEQHFRSLYLSQTFSIGVLSHLPTSPSIASSSPSQQWLTSPIDDPVKPSTFTRILPPLPPLFAPPPFTPSHPVFASLSTCAITKSNELRTRAEEETRTFVKSQLDTLEKEEVQLRREVEGIWRGYREGWKEMLGRVNEERRRSRVAQPEVPTLAASAKSGLPMSIRDFSPIAPSHAQGCHSNHSPSQIIFPPSTSLLSASLVQSGTHLPTSVFRSPAPEPIMSTSATHFSYPGDSKSLKMSSPYVNGTNLTGSASSTSPKAHNDVHLPGAFKRNMDTNVDIASSVAWAQGEEEMRRRFGGGEDEEPRERARKRTSKNLGIGAVEKKLDANSTFSTENQNQLSPNGGSQPSVRSGPPLNSNTATQSTPKGQVEVHRSMSGCDTQPAQPETSYANGSTDRGRRRVTFDVRPEIAIAQKGTADQPKNYVNEIELFDLDDLSSTEPFVDSDLLRSSKPSRPQPVNRTPSYKLRPNDGTSTLLSSQPASLPAPRAMTLRSPVNGNPKWTSASVRRSVGLADALPLLSSSVPVVDRILTNQTLEASTREKQQARSSPTTSSPPSRSASTSLSRITPNVKYDRTPSPAPPSLSNLVTEPAEVELKQLLAASAPSHRHAWREGGRAWEMFHRRSQDKQRVKGAIAEEGSEGTPSSLDDGSDDCVDDSPTRGPWRNPSHFASSLPVQIRPFAQYQATLEPKTSLADKQGVLVPPLKATKRTNSATAIRRAVYAERDRIRSIDPGPTLDFSDQEDNEEDDIPDDTMAGDRGRRHALSILQARSVVPEAGMWRSMAS